MRTKLEQLFPQYRLTLAVTLIAGLIGAFGVVAIPKEEDPRLLNRNGFVKVVFPGADTEKIESWVVAPLESRLQSISAVKNIETKIRPEVAVLGIELKDSVKDTESAWNEVQRELDAQGPDFPAGVTETELERDVLELEAVLISVAHPDPVTLSDEAFRLKHDLEQVAGVKDIVLHGDPEVGINVQIRPRDLAHAGITVPQLIQQVQDKNRSIPAGSLATAGSFLQLSARNSLDTAEDVGKIPLLLSDLRSRPLSSLGTVTRAASIRPNSIVYFNQQRAMVLGVIPESPIDVLTWGQTLKARLAQWRAQDPRTTIQTFAFQPERSRERIRDLTQSLVIGMGSVVIILGLWMGWRTGIVVAVSVPLISVIGFGIYFLGGGVLHQISMAALLLSLGQFIDNVTVVAESAQRRIDAGADPVEAARQSADQFRLPMIFATGTAVAAFLPLLAAEGPTSEFTSSIPLIAVITLLASYFFALQTTPILCALLLAPSKGAGTAPAGTAPRSVLRSPLTVLAGTVALVVASLASFAFIPKQFFPGADRNEFRFSLHLPEGSSIFQTEAAARQVERALAGHAAVASVATFVGQSTPHFYYSLITEARVPNRADFLVHTKSAADNTRVIRDTLRSVALPRGTQLIPKILTQGPPTEAGVELELFHADYPALVRAAHAFVDAHPEYATSNLRTTAPRGLARATIRLDEGRGSEQGFDRNNLAVQLLSWSQGLEVSSYFDAGEKFPIRLIQRTGDRGLEDLGDLVAVPTRFRDFPLRDYVTVERGTSPSVLERKNGQRYVRVFAELGPNQGHNEVAPKLRAALLRDLRLDDLVIREGGQSGESETANLAILRALPLGILLLVGCLLYEFRSYRKLLLVLASVAVVSLGAFPGLLLGGQSFGFTALLGILALSGIVVNNCILIIEAIEEHKAEGLSTGEAIAVALRLRTRPIVLTTVMTLAGLLPLALEKSTLWPPMAWAMISGLCASTFVSLFTIPELYRRIFPMLALVLLGASAGVRAEALSFTQLVPAIEHSDFTQAQQELVGAKEASVSAQVGATYLPKVAGSVERVMNDRNLYVRSPLGAANYGRNSYNLGGVELRQTVLAATQFRGQVEIKDAELQSQRLESKQAIEDAKLSALKLALLLSETTELEAILLELERNLTAQKLESTRLQFQGRTAPSDVTKVEVELIQNSRNLEGLRTRREDYLNQLKPLVPGLTELKPLRTEQLLNPQIKPVAQGREPWGLAALAKKGLALHHAEGALQESYLPQVDIVAKYQNTEQGFLINQTSWYTLGVQLRWNIFDGGTNYHEARARAAERRSVQHQRAFLESQRSSAVTTLERDLLRLREDLRAYRDTTSRVTKVLKQERIYYAAGKVSLNQVLETERLLIQQKRQLIEAAFRQTMVGLDLWHLEGIELDEQAIKERVSGG